MSRVVSMLVDQRPIHAVMWGESEGYLVGSSGVERIVCYGENGQGAVVPWFAVYKNGEIMARVNAAQIDAVTYQPPRKEDTNA